MLGGHFDHYIGSKIVAPHIEMSNSMATLNDYDTWKASLRNFDWLEDVVSGATDLDVFIERKGQFLVLETKAWLSDTGMRMPFGQYLALKALAKVSSFTVLLVGETVNDTLYVKDMATAISTRISPNAVLFSEEQFEKTDKNGLAETVSAWYVQASTQQRSA